MALDPRYITDLALTSYFVDKITGEPLSGGIIEFWEDDNRNVPKPVFQLSGAPPDYTYTQLPNPLELNGVGQLQDANGNIIPIYYFPYDSDLTTANIQLYYIVVKDSHGTVQNTLQGWPNITAEDNPVTNHNDTIVNQLSNPQFVDVLFDPTTTFTVSFSGTGSTSVNIAPDWTLNVSYIGTGNVQITRNAIVGSLQYPTNPPYTMTFIAGSNITALSLVQRLSHNPDIWSPNSADVNGYLAGNIVIGPGSSIIMSYKPSVGVSQQILAQTNSTGAFQEYGNVIQLTPASNTDSSNTGYVDIVLTMPTSGSTTLTSVQVVGLETNAKNVLYNQVPVNRQYDQLFHYYYPLLSAKPIPSYLIGWDFPQNPAQALTSTVAAFSTGSSTSNYVWDQTIVYQSLNNGPSFSRSPAGALRVTCSAPTTQFALIQYLPQASARELLNGRLSVNVAASTSITAGILGTISLWYTATTLPSMGSNNSIVASLNADGSVATLHGTWTQVPRSGLGNAQITIKPSSTTQWNDYGLSGWDLNGSTDINTVTYFAIVVGFSSFSSADTVDFGSISLVPGDIPTRPAPESTEQSLLKCQAFYEKSFDVSTLPAQNIGVGTGETVFLQGYPGIANGAYSPSYTYKATKSSIPSTITTYSPGDASANIWNIPKAQISTVVSTVNNHQDGFQLTFNTTNPSATGDALGVHWTSDARLGF